DSELGWLLQQLALAGAGERRVVLVGGPSRVGRTRLVAELAASAFDGGAVVLYGATTRGSHRYQVVSDALRRWVLWGPVHSVEHLAGIAGLGTLVPALGVRLGRSLAPNVRPSLSPDDVSDIVDAVLASSADLAPVVLVLEDLQWADPLTIE